MQCFKNAAKVVNEKVLTTCNLNYNDKKILWAYKVKNTYRYCKERIIKKNIIPEYSKKIFFFTTSPTFIINENNEQKRKSWKKNTTIKRHDTYTKQTQTVPIQYKLLLRSTFVFRQRDQYIH